MLILLEENPYSFIAFYAGYRRIDFVSRLPRFPLNTEFRWTVENELRFFLKLVI